MSIRVVITDDHPVVRDGLRYSIERSGGDIQVVGEAVNGRELLDLAAKLQVDVYVMDVTMPLVNGIEATRVLLKRDPLARVLMLSLQSSCSVVTEALQAGARGFLTKETATRCVVDAITEVAAGRYYLSPDISHCVVKGFLGRELEASGREEVSVLTARERQMLQLIAEGHTNKDIAVHLKLSVNTVQKHRANLMAKLDLHDQVALVRYALKEGIAKP